MLAYNRKLPAMPKKQENMIHNEEREIDLEITQVIEFVDKDIKTAIKNILHVSKGQRKAQGCYGEMEDTKMT